MLIGRIEEVLHDKPKTLDYFSAIQLLFVYYLISILLAVSNHNTMLLLLPELFQPQDIKGALTLLEWQLNTGDPVNVNHPFVKKLIEAQFLTNKGVLNPELPTMFGTLLGILDHPELYGAIREESGGDVLKILKNLEPENAAKFKEIIRRAAGEAPTAGGLTKTTTSPPVTTFTKSDYAVKVAKLLDKRPVDETWIYTEGSHSVRPERIVYKLKKDLATSKVIEKLPAKDSCAARWKLYEGILDDEAFDPPVSLLKQAGVEESSVPALRAHRNRSGLYLIPSQFILHIGKQVLRVAVFSTLNQHNESAFQQLRARIQKLDRPAEVRLSAGKTFQLDVEIKDPADMAPEALEKEIRSAWGKIRSVLEKL